MLIIVAAEATLSFLVAVERDELLELDLPEHHLSCRANQLSSIQR